MGTSMDYSPVWDAQYAKVLFMKSHSWQEKKALRRKAFAYTCEAIEHRSIRIIERDCVVSIPLVLNDFIPSRFYDAASKPSPVQAKKPFNTQIEVVNEDCIDAAKRLLDETDETPLVLNMASSTHPGGGVISGAGAQEENLCRRSDYVRSLFSYSPLAEDYHQLGIQRNLTGSYPLDPEEGAIYSEGVTIFRGNEAEGYPFLRQGFTLDFIAVAALNLRSKSNWLRDDKGNYLLSAEEKAITCHKIRLMLRIAYQTGHHQLVLSAFGCGAFCNPAKEIANLFAQVLQEEEFAKAFEHIRFAIIEDHNSRSEINPSGNFRPFAQVFSK